MNEENKYYLGSSSLVHIVSFFKLIGWLERIFLHMALFQCLVYIHSSPIKQPPKLFNAGKLKIEVGINQNVLSNADYCFTFFKD